MDHQSNVANKTFHFRGQDLFELARKMGKVQTLHQAGARGGISYPTARSYVKPVGAFSDKISLQTLYQFLTRGLGYTDEELGRLSFLEVLAIIQGTEVVGSPEWDPDKLAERLAGKVEETSAV